MKKPKIVLIDNRFVRYQIPLSLILNKHYDINFWITRQSKQDIKSLKEISDLKYKCFKPKYIGKFIFSFGILKELFFSNYDIIISHDPHSFESIFAGYISKLRNKKFIIYSETWDWPRHLSSKILNPFIWLMFKFTDTLLVTSKKAATYSQKLGYSKHKKYFIVYLSSFDYYNKTNKKELYKEIPQTRNKKIILFLNRIVPYKGLDYLIKALPKLNNVHLIICGTDYPNYKTRNINYQEEIKKLIEDLKLKNISFVGYSEEKKKFYLTNSDLVVFPTTMRDFDGESWGSTIIESLSAKKPIIVTNAVGCAEEVIQNEKNGLIIPHNNIGELTNAINKIISDNKFAKQIGENARKAYKNITWQKAFKVHKEALEYVHNKE